MRVNLFHGLRVNIIKLNGTLDVDFEGADGKHDSKVIERGDTQDTIDMDNARKKAFGDPIHVQDVEMFIEELRGRLHITFTGSNGEVFDFKRQSRSKAEGSQQDPHSVSQLITSGQGANNGASAHANPYLKDTRDVFETYHEGTSATTVDYLLFKHIYVQGYRTGVPNILAPEGRLHVDLTRAEMYWETFEDDIDFTRITLERIKISRRGTVSTEPLEKVHTFGTHALEIIEHAPFETDRTVFAMDWRTDRAGEVFGNHTGTGADRTYFEGPVKGHVALDAIKKCIKLKETACDMGF